MHKHALYLRRIKEAHPDLAVESARLHTGHGQFNDVLVLNETLIFRFPRWGEAGRGLAVEARILKVIREHVTLPVPNPIYGDPEAEDPAQRFIGYPLIPGEPLWRETLETITGAEVVTRLATQLGVFMRELHGLPAAFLPELRKADGPDYWTALYASFQTELFPFMRPDARDGVTRHFESYLSESRHFAYTPVLRHGDFGFGNILYDARSRRITGVIDWSSAGLGDPAVDVSAITSSSAEFVRAIEAVYPVTEAMRQRITFYRGTYALQQALYALRGDDQESFADGDRAVYLTRMSSPPPLAWATSLPRCPAGRWPRPSQAGG